MCPFWLACGAAGPRIAYSVDIAINKQANFGLESGMGTRVNSKWILKNLFI